MIYFLAIIILTISKSNALLFTDSIVNPADSIFSYVLRSMELPKIIRVNRSMKNKCILMNLLLLFICSKKIAFPEGFKTRRSSFIPEIGSGTMQNTNVLMMVSKVLSSKDRFCASISLKVNSFNFVYPYLCWAIPSIPELKSIAVSSISDL